MKPVVPDPVDDDDDAVAETDQIHEVKTSQTSQARYPENSMPKAVATAELRPMVAMLPLSR